MLDDVQCDCVDLGRRKIWVGTAGVIQRHRSWETDVGVGGMLERDATDCQRLLYSCSQQGVNTAYGEGNDGRTLVLSRLFRHIHSTGAVGGA